MQVKSRHHLRADAVDDLETALAEQLGVDVDADTYEKVELEGTTFDIVLVDDEPAVMYVESEAANASDGEPFLTVHGANEYTPERRIVTVDAGAISFVSNGADVMRPGITEATDDIAEGDLVVIAEETHGKILAVGRARTDGDDMSGEEGKVVDSIHHVGDELYEFSV